MRDFYSLFHASFGTKVLVGAILSILGFFFDALLVKVFAIVILLTLFDCVLGYARAMTQNKAVVSRVMSRYMWKFVGYMLASSSLFLMDQTMPEVLHPLTGWLDNFALAFFAVHETISIIEHLNEIGVPMPTRLLGNLRKIRSSVDESTLPEEDKYKTKKQKTDIIK